MANRKNDDFYPEEIERLRIAWLDMMERKSESSGSAFGEHYILLGILRECGVRDSFESSSQIENYVEYVITYGKRPQIF